MRIGTFHELPKRAQASVVGMTLGSEPMVCLLDSDASKRAYVLTMASLIAVDELGKPKTHLVHDFGAMRIDQHPEKWVVTIFMRDHAPVMSEFDLPHQGFDMDTWKYTVETCYFLRTGKTLPIHWEVIH